MNPKHSPILCGQSVYSMLTGDNAAHAGYVPDAEAYPKLTAYLTAIHARPSFGDWIRRDRKMLGLG